MTTVYSENKKFEINLHLMICYIKYRIMLFFFLELILDFIDVLWHYCYLSTCH